MGNDYSRDCLKEILLYCFSKLNKILPVKVLIPLSNSVAIIYLFPHASLLLTYFNSYRADSFLTFDFNHC